VSDPRIASADNGSSQLVAGLGLLDSTFIVVGIVVGSGVFLSTGIMARDLPSPLLIMVAWAMGGGFAVIGALTFAELGAAMPGAGGQYVYLRESYGRLAAFLFGWLILLIYQTGAISSLTAAFVEYFGYFVPELGTGHTLFTAVLGTWRWPVSAGQMLACGIIGLLTLVNVRGLQTGSSLNNLLTWLKLGAMAAFVLLAFTVGHTKGAPLELNPQALAPGQLLRGFGIGFIAVLWAFDGWNNINYSASEIRRPEWTLPRALLLGTVLTTVTYLAMNAAYLHALPIREMAGVTRIAERAAAALFGPWAATMIVVVILISVLGATHGSILTGARVYYAMARDGLFFEPVGRVHPRFRTPHVALWLQGVWSCVLVVSGRYDQLFTYAMFSSLLLYAAAVASVFTLRRTRPDMPRPYRVWGYPVVPFLFLVAIGALIVNTLMERPVESLTGLGLLALGLPAYVLLRWASRSRTAAEAVR
jgi:APA family basic amino acid/polyamine antiporter